jgi:CRISPR-associated endonuclease Csn1
MRNSHEYMLGIDLGSASLGWALIQQADGGPCGVLAAGVRVFDPGVDGRLDQGQEESRNKKRREARLQRRQIRRRAARRRELFALLQSVGLLPAIGPENGVNESASRHATLNALDQRLWREFRTVMEQDPRIIAGEHVLPYYLRARAIEEKLEPFELGRALYHLGQRRGFKSNRKAEPKKDEKEGEVKTGIAELDGEMSESRARTLGEHFSGLDPNTQKIRRRWTARRMFTSEFERIWQTQAQHHAEVLTPALKAQVGHLLFF